MKILYVANKMEDVDRKFVEVYKEISKGEGIDESVSAIFARIYIEPEDISMEDLAKETGYSLASISNKVNMLELLLPIKKIRKPGTKKIFLSVEKNMMNILKEVFIRKEEHCVHVTKEKLPPIIEECKKKAKSENDKKKLKIIEDYYKQIIQFEEGIHKMIERFDEMEK